MIMLGLSRTISLGNILRDGGYLYAARLTAQLSRLTWARLCAAGVTSVERYQRWHELESSRRKSLD